MAKKQLTIEEKLEAALVPVEEQPYKVPENWCWVRLGSVTTRIKRGKSPKYVDESEFPVFAQKCNQKDGTIALEKARFLNPDMAMKLSEEEFLHENDVVINSTGTGTLGRVGFFREQDKLSYEKILPDSHVTVVRPSTVVENFFLYLFLKGKQSFLELQGAGSTNQKELRPATISELMLPLPPQKEQSRIVARIESLFAKLDEAKEKIQEVLDGADLRRAAILHQAFTGKLTEKWRMEKSVSDAGWQDVYIEDIAQVKGGKRVPKGMSLTVENTGHPYIKAGNLKQGTVISDNIMFVPDDVLPYIKKYTVNVGDVYITNVGACIGDCGVIPAEFDGANLTENAVKLTDLECDSNYLAKYIASDFVQVEIKTRIASATLGKLSIANIKKIKVKLPTFSEQQEIVRLLDNLLSREQSTVTACEKALATIGVLKKSILARAFRGELGTGDPREASAKELLQEILAS